MVRVTFCSMQQLLILSFAEAIHEVQNKRAVSVYNRVQHKLTG